MLERSDLAENALQALRDEGYDRPVNTQSLNADTLIAPAAASAAR